MPQPTKGNCILVLRVGRFLVIVVFLLLYHNFSIHLLLFWFYDRLCYNCNYLVPHLYDSCFSSFTVNNCVDVLPFIDQFGSGLLYVVSFYLVCCIVKSSSLVVILSS